MARRRPFHAVLLAGGSGTRFWPLSRADRPKQLLRLLGSESMLQSTWNRVRGLAPPERRWVVVPQALAREVRRALPELDPRNLIVEPSPRDTAPAVALACCTLARRDPLAVAGIFPTDHHIDDRRGFASTVRTAAQAADPGGLLCLGVRPDRPATGFGYLRCAGRPRRGQATKVLRFVEKPTLARARRFLRSGEYLWNAGMFVWRVDCFLEELRRVAPAILRAVERHLQGDPRAWGRAPRRSVDYAVMERAREVRVVPLASDWSDVGSWDAVARLRERGRRPDDGQPIFDSPGSMVFGGQRTVVLIGVSGVIVVDTDDAVLVVARKEAERVKQAVAWLRDRGREELL